MRLTRTLVTGAGGMLGMDLVRTLSAAGQAYTALSHGRLDITDAYAVAQAVRGHDVVINAAAWTDVDGAERDEAAATRVNGTGVANLARACAAAGAVLIQVSTDAVFDGRAATPYAEDAPTCPISAYGRSKLLGERAVLLTMPEHGYVVRTSWLYGKHGRSFPRIILERAASHPGEPIEVVGDQWGSPTWSKALAVRLLELASAALDGTAPPGIYHATATGVTTWYDLASAVFATAGFYRPTLVPVPLEQYLRAAPQGHYGVLGHEGWARTGLKPMAHWCDMLAEAFEEIR